MDISLRKEGLNLSTMHWVNEDQGYEAWRKSHPHGFMANLRNPARGKYFIIHRAAHDLPDRSIDGSINPRTGRQYSKVTANTIADLVRWAKSNLPNAEPTYCKVCAPTDNTTIDTTPTPDVDEYIRRSDRLRVCGVLTRPEGELSPTLTSITKKSFYRDPKVRAWVINRAEGCCELCGNVPFIDAYEEPFLEVHHVVMLADGGPDTPRNTAALCPNCHRRLHYGLDRDSLREQLLRAINTKESA